MDTEWKADVARRAAVHGVLSDPGRLAVVDLLSQGDHSPSELAAALGMASNLLAHHLRVLEEHGVVTRARSEGDRRRTYLRLVPGSTDTSGRRLVPTPARLLFVCTANSARSHLAAALWRRASVVPATSAGTRPAAAIHDRAVTAAQRHGLRLERVVPRHVRDVRRPDDLVVTVCDAAHEEVGALADAHWSVPDPVPAGDDDAFDAAVEELERRVAELAPALDPTPAPPPSHPAPAPPPPHPTPAPPRREDHR